jgi:hypothetical protein
MSAGITGVGVARVNSAGKLVYYNSPSFQNKNSRDVARAAQEPARELAMAQEREAKFNERLNIPGSSYGAGSNYGSGHRDSDDLAPDGYSISRQDNGHKNYTSK